MTTNRRPLRRKHHAQNEHDMWETYMMYGVDYFRQLERAGLSKEDVEREAPHVWQRHAARYVTTWQSDPHWGEGPLPYGAKKFGYQPDSP